MWSVRNGTRFGAAGAWSRNRDGRHVWNVCVRAAFRIDANGMAVPEDEQPPPRREPEFRDDPSCSSLLHEVELVGGKPTTDVLLGGTAHAPRDAGESGFAVSLRIGPIRKVLGVVGERRWQRGVNGLVPSRAKPLDAVPLVYERTFGGVGPSDGDPAQRAFDSRNPVGRGRVPREGEELPNIVCPGRPTDVAGFGPIASFWTPRLELAGTYDASWQAHRMPFLPLDWDARTLLCAPRDQLPSQPLAGGEAVEFVNIGRPGTTRFRLPTLSFTFRTFFAPRSGQRPVDHGARLSSVELEPDISRVVMVWCASLDCPAHGDELDETVVREGT